MSRKIQAEHGVVCRVPDSDYGYFGWPSVAKMPDGALAVAASGFRRGHICPWGRDVVVLSRDGGLTWGEPLVVHDSPLDDRDAGLVSLGGRDLLLTWFSLDPRGYGLNYGVNPSDEPNERVRRATTARLSALTDDGVKPYVGSWTRLSLDGGDTWSAPRRAPVTAPHGPILMKSQVLMYAGKPFPVSDGRPVNQSVKVALSIDLGATWKVIGEVPTPKGFEDDQIHEPHLVELPDGTLLCALRVHEKDTGAVWMSRSDDRGFTWAEPWRLPCDGTPPHLLRHSSGRIVCSYGYRHAPYGQRALISRDGVNWDEEIILRDDGPDGDLGYPASVEMDDGSILTVYYQRLPGDAQTSVLYTRWHLPDA